MYPEIIRVMLADDHPLILSGLRQVLEVDSRLRIVGTATTGQEALSGFLSLRPDVLVLDVQMPGLNGLEALKAIRVHDPAAKAVILTSYEGEEDIYQALVAGARAYLLKESPPLTIIECIIAVAAGRKYLPASVAATLAGRFDSNTLSHREMEVLRLLAEGKSNKVISRMIGIAEGTIKFHLNNIFGKLGVTSRTAAIASAVKRGLVRI